MRLQGKILLVLEERYCCACKEKFCWCQRIDTVALAKKNSVGIRGKILLRLQGKILLVLEERYVLLSLQGKLLLVPYRVPVLEERFCCACEEKLCSYFRKDLLR